MDVQTIDWLRTELGQKVLADAAQGLPTDALAASSRLRAAYAGQASAEQIAAALTQAQLRHKAAAKFGARASQMYFTADGLEQATRMSVAAQRASRLAESDTATLLDLGCGIGGDLIAAAEAGIAVNGVDIDPLRVAIAQANLEALGWPGQVRVADATNVEVAGFDALYVDPARRTARGRTFSVADQQPPWEFTTHLLATASACVKTAPGIAHQLIPDGVEAEWVSDRGALKEACLWSGRFATAPRRATVITADESVHSLTEICPNAPTADAAEYLYEPDGAVIRAGLVTSVASIVDGHLIDPKIAWVSASTLTPTPFAKAYAVIERLPYRLKQLRSALRARDVGPVTIKPRGVDVVPEKLRQQLGLKGRRAATIVLTREHDRAAVFLVEGPLPAGGSHLE